MASTEVRSTSSETIPSLEFGDRLTRGEFERRYAAMPKKVKAELIGGMVYMASPARQSQHGGPQFDLMYWLGHYCAATPGVEGGDNATLRIDDENEPQPDALLYIERERGGQSRIDEEGYLEGAPEFVAEVASSSVSYDLHDKLDLYRDSGVREYLVWRVADTAIDWFVLEGGAYVRLPADEPGTIRSRILPGLWLDAPAMLRRDPKAVIARLEQGLATAEHAEFVKRLARPGRAE